ncbi:hypothetical protein ACX40Y_00420 [Sphingomonas sp. RS6]
MNPALAFEIMNLALCAVLFAWATADAVTAKALAACLCNALLAFVGLLGFMLALHVLAGLALA